MSVHLNNYPGSVGDVHNVSEEINATLSLNKMSQEASMIAGYYMSIVSILGIGINIMLLTTFWRHPLVLHAQMHLVKYMCVCNLLMAIVAFPLIVVSCIANDWIFGDAGCQIYGFLMTLTAFTSVALLSAMALQRFVVVVTMRQASSLFQQGVNRWIGVLCAFIAMSLAILPFAGVGTYDLEPGFLSCTPRWWGKEKYDFVYIMLILVCAFFLPLTIICGSYTGILIKLKLHDKSQLIHSSQAKRQHRLALIVFLLIFAFFLSWGPYAIFALLQAFKKDFRLSPITRTLPVMLAKSCVLWDPIIYTISFEKFRTALRGDILKLISRFHSRCSLNKRTTRNRRKINTSRPTVEEVTPLGQTTV